MSLKLQRMATNREMETVHNQRMEIRVAWRMTGVFPVILSFSSSFLPQSQKKKKLMTMSFPRIPIFLRRKSHQIIQKSSLLMKRRRRGLIEVRILNLKN
jgi:hypothetical protein